MDKIPLGPFLLQSFPENIIIITIGLIMIGIKPDFKKLLVVAFLSAIFSYMVRSSPIIFGLHLLLQLAFLITIARLILKYSLFQTIVAMIIGVLTLGVSEIILLPLLLAISGFTLDQVLANPWYRVVIQTPYIFILGLLAYQLYRKKWFIIGYYKIDMIINRLSKPFYYLVILVFLQATFLTLVVAAFYVHESGFFFSFTQQSLLLFTIIIMIISILLTITVAYLMLQVGHKEVQLQSEYRHLHAMQNVYIALRQQRHDIVNHIMAIHGFLQAGEKTKALKYITTIYSETSKNQALLNLGMPGLSGLVEAKRVQADKRGIKLNVSVDPGFSGIPVKPHDLTGIIGNIVDNALDAAKPVDNRAATVCIELLHEGEGYSIIVENTGLPLNSDVSKKMFNADFTTKKDKAHSGLGLYTVYNLVKKYKGEIMVGSPAKFQGVRFAVNID